MNVNQKDNTDMPIRGNLKIDYVVSGLIAVLMVVASAGGLLYQNYVYPNDELLNAFVPNDAVNLVIGLPILLASMWFTRRGRLIGLLMWPGALFYVFYTYVVYVFSMPFGLAYVLHLVLFTLSGYAMAVLTARIEGKKVQDRLVGTVAERVGGGVLAGFGLLFLVRVTAIYVSAILNQTTIPTTELALNAADFLISPAFILGGVLLWRREVFGYVSGLGLLFQASMLFIGLIAVLMLQPFITNVQFVLVDVVVVFVMGMICFIPFILFVRGVAVRTR